MKVKNIFNFTTLFICIICFALIMILEVSYSKYDPGNQGQILVSSEATSDVTDKTKADAASEPAIPDYETDITYNKPTGQALCDTKTVVGRTEAGTQVIVSCKDKRYCGIPDENGNYAVSIDEKIRKKEKITVQTLKDNKVSDVKKVKIINKKLNGMFCKSYTLIDLHSGDVICSYRPGKKIFPASTTKIMTGILALENINDLNTQLTASKKAIYGIGWGGSSVHSYIGEKMVLKDWLRATMLSSANEGAIVLAEGVSGSVKKFAKLMNKKAIEIGCKNTHFVNANGLPDDKHYTTASDLAKIARYAMDLSPESEQFRSVVGMKKYVLPKTNKHSEKRKMKSTNKLMKMHSDCYEKVIGVKTGHTTSAGYVFVGCARDDNGRELLSVVAGAGTAYGTYGVFEESKRLLDFGYEICQAA